MTLNKKIDAKVLKSSVKAEQNHKNAISLSGRLLHALWNFGTFSLFQFYITFWTLNC
jgi:hypothetical protein